MTHGVARIDPASIRVHFFISVKANCPLSDACCFIAEMHQCRPENEALNLIIFFNYETPPVMASLTCLVYSAHFMFFSSSASTSSQNSKPLWWLTSAKWWMDGTDQGCSRVAADNLLSSRASSLVRMPFFPVQCPRSHEFPPPFDHHTYDLCVGKPSDVHTKRSNFIAQLDSPPSFVWEVAKSDVIQTHVEQSAWRTHVLINQTIT